MPPDDYMNITRIDVERYTGLKADMMIVDDIEPFCDFCHDEGCDYCADELFEGEMEIEVELEQPEFGLVTNQVGTLNDYSAPEKAIILAKRHMNRESFERINPDDALAVWEAIQANPLAMAYWHKGQERAACFVVGAI